MLKLRIFITFDNYMPKGRALHAYMLLSTVSRFPAHSQEWDKQTTHIHNAFQLQCSPLPAI